MFVVMHCGGIPFNGDTIKTKSLGGSESAAYYLAKELVKSGHNVRLFTNSTDTGCFDGVNYEYAGTPSEGHPLGDRFHFYAESTPHDICIVQRHPLAFSRKLASKQNYLWLHDLALYRNKDSILASLWNIDRILCVSEFHKKQVGKVWGIPAEAITVIGNGVDLAMYDEAAPMQLDESRVNLFYSSRPERGLVNLVSPDGIMEQLLEAPVTLHVCHYDNTTPAMAGLYQELFSMADELPNVVMHGSLTKAELASLQKSCSAWVYPSSFEETSCITAMEAMAAGCNVLTTTAGALPETCSGAIGYVLPLMKNGEPDKDAFVREIQAMTPPARTRQRAAASRFAWSAVAERLTAVIIEVFNSASVISKAHHFMRHSDIPALAETLKECAVSSPLVEALEHEYDISYKFYRNNTYSQHYADYYDYEKKRGVVYGPEDVTGTTRFMAVNGMISRLPAGSHVLDYGCAHGHYTIALARLHPDINFVGADITQSNIDSAKDWAVKEGLRNIDFVKVSSVDTVGDLFAMNAFNAIIAAEVIEHVGDPQYYIDNLASHLHKNGVMILTVPFGPWEAQGYREHKFWRAHLHHFERADLLDMLGHHPDFNILTVPSGQSIFHSQLGSYVVTFGKPVMGSKAISIHRKISTTMPDQTISCCMIVKDAEQDIARCLNSVTPFVQEVIIGVDANTSDMTRDILAAIEKKNPLVAFHIFDMPAVVDVGFDTARNFTIEKASGDWVLWIDADEVLVNGQMLALYLRNNCFSGYAIPQHHMSLAPLTTIHVDLPVRIFRNNIGVKFFGKVHEHPEKALNEGLGSVATMPSVYIVHYGYYDEATRRKRFNRNLPLMKRDRKLNPERHLGKYLYVRDLAQMCQYEDDAGVLTDSNAKSRTWMARLLWDELLYAKQTRLAVEALPYYSYLNGLMGGGVSVSFVLDASMLVEANCSGQQKVEGYFETPSHAMALVEQTLSGKIDSVEVKYL